MSLAQLQKTLNYTFSQPELLQQALTHRSAAAKNNERLEFLGDSIVGMFIAKALFKQFEHAKEGELTRMRAALVNQGALSKLSRQLKLADYLHLGQGELKSGGFDRDSILADAFEAVVGAIYLDSDIDTTFLVLDTLFAQELALINLENLKDPKTRLQEYMQSQNKTLPQYELVQQSGPAHNLTFCIRCQLDDGHVFKASASSRRQAEQKAAQKALDKFKV